VGDRARDAPLNRFSFRHCARSSLIGAALGGWFALWAWITVHGAQWGWGIVELSEAQGKQYFPLEEYLSRVLAPAGLAMLGKLSSLSWILLFAGAALGLVIALLGQQLRIDPERSSRRAILDVLARPGAVLAWTLPCLCPALAGLAVRDWDWLMFLPWPIALVTLLFMANRGALEGSAPRVFRFWQPGLRGLAAFAVVLACGIAIGILLEGLEHIGGTTGTVAAEIIDYPKSLVFGLLALAIWFDGMGLAQLRSSWRRILDRRALGAFVALDVRVAAIALVLAAPFLAASVTLIFVLPQLEELASRHGAVELPVYWHWIRQLTQNWWFTIAPALVPVCTAISGRLYVLCFPARSEVFTLAS
jgi:hypothetical protein